VSTDEPTGEPTPEEIAARIVERLARTQVRDILLQSLATLIDSAGIRVGLGPNGDEDLDLAQAHQAIEGARALIGVVEQELGPAQARPFRDPMAMLQMAYARAIEGGAPPPDAPAGGPEEPPGGGGAPPGDPADRLWVPPGTRR
jgi:hypothetical protein